MQCFIIVFLLNIIHILFISNKYTIYSFILKKIQYLILFTLNDNLMQIINWKIKTLKINFHSEYYLLSFLKILISLRIQLISL